MTSTRKGRPKRISLKQIGQELNVSESFVSKVLSGRMGTSSARTEMAEAIRAKAAELGYRKNQTASALARGRHHVIAVMIHHHGNPGSGLVESMLAGISTVANGNGQRLALSFFIGRKEFFAALPAVDGSEVDGLIIGGISHPDILEELRERQSPKVPVVTILPDSPQNVFPNIGLDDSALTYLTTAHLLAQGCRRLAHFSMFQSRLDGFMRAHADAGVAVVPELVVACKQFSYADGVEATQALLARELAFDGIVAQSDDHAVAAVNILTRRGIRVPAEVRVAGIDNSPVCPTCIVPLTSVSQNDRERGADAAGRLLAAIAGESISSVSHAPTLYPRESSGPHLP